MAPIVLDGTTLEGGGQLVRLAIGVSALVGRPVQINNIRWGRSGGGGLKSQHLTAIAWLAVCTNAEVEGLALKSKPLPDGRIAKAMSIDLKAPGAITLVLQAVLPFVVFRGNGTIDDAAALSGKLGPIILQFKGGTNVSFSPSIDYVSQVLLPNLALIGLDNISIGHSLARGWSTGDTQMGSVTFMITPLPMDTTLKAATFSEKGQVVKITATLLVPAAARVQMREEVLATLARRFPKVAERVIVVDEDSGHMKRLYLLLVAHTDKGHRIGRDWLYDSKAPKDAESLSRAVKVLVKKVSDKLDWELSTSASFDIHMEDQLVVYQALAQGESSIQHSMLVGNFANRQPSLHTRTARWVVKEILGVDFEFDEVAARCMGVSAVNASSAVRKDVDKTVAEGLDNLKV